LAEVKCSLCGATMTHKKLRGNEFYECPECGAELWTYDEKPEKAIRKVMYATSPKKRGKGSRRRRFKPRKPGEKWVPWYRR
jgi:hypothetical protein